MLIFYTVHNNILISYSVIIRVYSISERDNKYIKINYKRLLDKRPRPGMRCGVSLFFFSRSFDKRLYGGRGTHTFTNYTKAFIKLSIVFSTMTHKRRRYLSYNVLYNKYLQNVMYDASRKKSLPAYSHRVWETVNSRWSFSRLSIKYASRKKRTQKRYFEFFPTLSAIVCAETFANRRRS